MSSVRVGVMISSTIIGVTEILVKFGVSEIHIEQRYIYFLFLTCQCNHVALFFEILTFFYEKLNLYVGILLDLYDIIVLLYSLVYNASNIMYITCENIIY